MGTAVTHTQGRRAAAGRPAPRTQLESVTYIMEFHCLPESMLCVCNNAKDID